MNYEGGGTGLIESATAPGNSSWQQLLVCEDCGKPIYSGERLRAHEGATRRRRPVRPSGRGLNLALAVGESAWTPERHIFVCTEETCETVCVLLLHFCRVLGTSAGSAFVKSVVARALGEWPQEEAEKRQRRFDMVLSWRALQTGNDVV